jgi:hypothetical protein
MPTSALYPDSRQPNRTLARPQSPARRLVAEDLVSFRVDRTRYRSDVRVRDARADGTVDRCSTSASLVLADAPRGRWSSGASRGREPPVW